MSRYQETAYRKGLENAINTLDEILDLVEEVKRKTSSKSIHIILDQISKTAGDNRGKSFSIFEKIKK